MRPVFAAALAAAVVAAIATLGGRASRVTPAPRRQAPSAASAPVSLCPPGSLPDDGVCIPVPPPGRTAIRSRVVESIPRRPDREPEYTRYALPVVHAISVAELGERAAADGGVLPSGIALQTDPGSEVAVPSLKGQDGPAEVLFAGGFWGPTVITAHTVQEGGVTQRYLIALGGLGTVRPLPAGESAAPGALLGTAGRAPVILEARLVRPGIELQGLGAPALLNDANSVPTDPRNVLAQAP